MFLSMTGQSTAITSKRVDASLKPYNSWYKLRFAVVVDVNRTIESREEREAWERRMSKAPDSTGKLQFALGRAC